MPYILVAKLEDIPFGSGKLVEMEERDVALFRLGDVIYATSDVCPHQGASLSTGHLNGEKIVCPWHQWCFNIKDGISPLNPRLKIKTYPVKQEGNMISILVPE